MRKQFRQTAREALSSNIHTGPVSSNVRSARRVRGPTARSRPLHRRRRLMSNNRKTFRPSLDALEDKLLLASSSSLLIVGVDQGPPHVKVFGENNREVASLLAFDPSS